MTTVGRMKPTWQERRDRAAQGDQRIAHTQNKARAAARARAVAKQNRPCTRQTARCRDARDYTHELRPCCREHIRAMLANIADVLTGAGVTWWADYGTLLGAVRNPMTRWADYPWLPQAGRETKGPHPGIVPHDKDADLGVLFTDWPRVVKLRKQLVAPGYYMPPNERRASMKCRVSHRNHTNVDLFFWRERRDGTLYRDHYAAVDRFKGREFPRAMLSPATTVEWEGLALPAPADPEAFLTMRYGPTWRTPLAANHAGKAAP